MSILSRAIIRSPSVTTATTLNGFTDNFTGVALDTSKWRQMFSHTVTVSTGAGVDCVVTDTAHGLVSGQPFHFTTTGSLPTPISQITTYYAKPINANTYNFSTTPGGSNFQTDSAGAGSGTHTARSVGYKGTGLKAFSVNNKLIMTSDGANLTNYGGIESVNYYNLTGNGIYLKLYNTTSAVAHQQIIHLTKDYQNILEYFNDGSNGLRVVTTIANTQTVQTGTLAWPGAVTWVRMRETGGNIEWATAPDSGSNTPGTWTTRKTLATPFAVTSVQVQIICGHFSGSAIADDIENFGGFNTTALS